MGTRLDDEVACTMARLRCFVDKALGLEENTISLKNMEYTHGDFADNRVELHDTELKSAVHSELQHMWKRVGHSEHAASDLKTDYVLASLRATAVSFER